MGRRHVRSINGIAIGALMVVVVACGADPNDSLSRPTTTVAPIPTSEVTYPANGERSAVVAIDNNFVPQAVTIAAGTEIVFTNNGRNPHNIVPADDPDAVSWGVHEDRFQPKDSYSRVFDRPGTYVYYCTIHGSPRAGMFGTITVTAP